MSLTIPDRPPDLVVRVYPDDCGKACFWWAERIQTWQSGCEPMPYRFDPSDWTYEFNGFQICYWKFNYFSRHRDEIEGAYAFWLLEQELRTDSTSQ